MSAACREIAFNRVTEELKQRIDCTKTFDHNKAFLAVDDWSYNYIDKTNLKSFLRKHGYLASTSDCMAIIRRLDLDADARLSKQEFIDGLRPEEPYSKLLKRTEMNRGLKMNACPRQAANRGHLIVLDDNARDGLRTHAMER